MGCLHFPPPCRSEETGRREGGGCHGDAQLGWRGRGGGWFPGQLCGRDSPGLRRGVGPRVFGETPSRGQLVGVPEAAVRGSLTKNRSPWQLSVTALIPMMLGGEKGASVQDAEWIGV